MTANSYDDEKSLTWRRKVILVGVHQLDMHSKELLDWALVKVANPGDIVFAIHVVSPHIHSSFASKQTTLLVDAYLDDYQGLCNEKQVTLNIQFFKGYSLRKVMVREAYNQSASAVVLGITKRTASRLWGSVAKYCAKKLPPTTEVMSVHNGKILFSRCTTRHIQGPGQDLKPTFYFNGNFPFEDEQSELRESEMSDISGFSFDGKDGKVICLNGQDVTRPFQRHKSGSMSLISLPVEDFTKQRPGWPLLQTASSITQPAIEARNLSVVQWVMTLPHRSLSNVSESISHTNAADTLEKENRILKQIKILAREKRQLKDVFTNNSAECKIFSHDVLKVSTSGFSKGNLIGKGGSNSVYKGILPEGKPVAVKILESSNEAWNEFFQEVDIMTTLKHERITPLLGICVEENDLISVYDCLSRGNLEENLHGNGQKKNIIVLPWEARYRIAVGIAEALNYLHNECARPVIHRDIKSSNILLTDELEPQLSDFGLAIWGPTKESFFMDSDVVGTFGYIAPEYFMYGKVSNKMDVYAFGVVLLELLSGRKPIIDLSDDADAAKAGQESLITWAKPKLESGELKSILDPKLEDNIDASQMQRMALAASHCLIQAARLRPDMRQILNILNGEEFAEAIKQSCSYENCSQKEDENDADDEVYPESCADSHLSLAFLDVNYELSNSTSVSSLDHQTSSPISVEEYLRNRCSRSSSLE